MRDDVSARIDALGVPVRPGRPVELGTARTRRTRCPPRRWRRSASTPGRGARWCTSTWPRPRRRTSTQRAEYGSVPALLDEVGLLGGRVLAAHGVQLSDADVALLARAVPRWRTAPVRTRSSPPGSRGSRRCAGPGVRVGLGTDGPASGDDLDLWARGPARRSARPGERRRRRRVDRGRAAADGHPRRRRRDRPRRPRRPRGRVAGPTSSTSTSTTRRSSTRPTTRSSCPTWCGRAARGWSRDVWVAGEPVLAGGEPTRVDRAASHRGPPRGRRPAATAERPPGHTEGRPAAVRCPPRAGLRPTRTATRSPAAAARGRSPLGVVQYLLPQLSVMRRCRPGRSAGRRGAGAARNAATAAPARRYR